MGYHIGFDFCCGAALQSALLIMSSISSDSDLGRQSVTEPELMSSPINYPANLKPLVIRIPKILTNLFLAYRDFWHKKNQLNCIMAPMWSTVHNAARRRIHHLFGKNVVRHITL